MIGLIFAAVVTAQCVIPLDTGEIVIMPCQQGETGPIDPSEYDLPSDMFDNVEDWQVVE